MMTPGDIDKLQKECDLEHMKEMIDKQQTQIRELIDKNKVVDLDYKEEYYKLQKENEELKERIREHTLLISPYYVKENFIPLQKVKDKIEEYKNMLKTCNKAKDIDRIKAINERILELQELIEGEK